jgi:small subunit ribosomal protein S20
MANHKSSLKRIRQAETKRVHNKYFARTTRNAVKELRGTSELAAAQEMLPKVTAMLDKLAKKRIIHKNKASNLKSSLSLHINALQK